jgi:hypothetical protein
MPLAWVPYTDRAEAERRLNGIPAGLELDFYRADGDELPGAWTRSPSTSCPT